MSPNSDGAAGMVGPLAIGLDLAAGHGWDVSDLLTKALDGGGNVSDLPKE